MRVQVDQLKNNNNPLNVEHFVPQVKAIWQKPLIYDKRENNSIRGFILTKMFLNFSLLVFTSNHHSYQVSIRKEMLNEKVIWIQTFVNNIDHINVTSNQKIYSHEFYKVILNSILLFPQF